MTKHTPGPWKACKAHEEYDGPFFDVEPEDVAHYAAKPFTRVCAAGGETIVTAHGFFTFRNGADARLIAAAPELLAALECARGWVPKGSPHRGMADEAIAKATIPE